MIADQQRTLDLLQPLLKILKDRQHLYFDALAFANKNIQSTSAQIDQILIFNKFLNSTAEIDSQIVIRETQLFNQVGPNQDILTEGYKVLNTSKYKFGYNRQMMRISARVLEILDASVDKARNTLFGQNGRLGVDFTKFKKSLHRTIRQDSIDLAQFSSVIVNFVKNKYRRQITRIRNYLNRLQSGEHVSLRDLFLAQGSDASASPDDKPYRTNPKSLRPHKKLLKESPQHESPLKKTGARKLTQASSRTKRTLNLKTTKIEQLQQYQLTHKKDRKMQKSATANLLLKFYSIMELNKKQFLEDYIFEQHEDERHKKRLLTELFQKNGKNGQFIREFIGQCQNFNFSNLNLQPNHHSSDQGQQSVYRNDSSANSRASMRTSFVISKRKGSFVFEPPSDRSDVEYSANHGKLPFSRTIKNFSPAAKKVQQKRQSTTIRPKKTTNNSKKIFVIKSPMTFDDEIIPKVQMANVAWVQAPLTGRDRQKNRRNEHIRLKKRNNPVPLDEKYLPQSFRVTQYPI